MSVLKRLIVAPVRRLTIKFLIFPYHISRMMMTVLLWREFIDSFKVREDDIFIVTYPKSGTTWMEMILYQLTTDGEMRFKHIAEIIPHIESPNLDEAGKRRLADKPSPRIFKTHLAFREVPKGPGKYIYLMRNGMDVALSYYPHKKVFFNFPGTFSQFYQNFLVGRVAFRSWFVHVRDWLSHKDELNTLVLKYEDIKDDMAGQVRKIAAFCNIELDDEKLARVVERSSFEYMKKYQDRFDLRNELAAYRFDSSIDFIRRGTAGGWRNELDQGQKAAFRQEFQKHLAGMGLDDYLPDAEAGGEKQTPPKVEAC